MIIEEIDKEANMLRDHAKRLKVGIDIFRNIEFALTIRLLSPNNNQKILDVGCGESILPTFMIKNYSSNITATDILNVEEVQRGFFEKSGLLGYHYGKKFSFKIENATKLSFDDNFFDSAYAVSSIEHIPNNGDSEAVREMSRVVSSGGTIIITVPFSPQYIEQETTHYYQGLERRYDYENLKNRIITAVDFPVEEYFLNNKFTWQDEFNNLWYTEKLYEPVQENSWRFSKALFSISDKPQITSRGAILKFKKQ